MIRFYRAALLAAAIAVFAGPGEARRITTDTGDTGVWGYFTSPGCTLDGSIGCTPIDLGFTADFGSGRTNQIFLYDDGMVTFGTPASGGFGPGAVAATLRDPAYFSSTIFQVGFFNQSANSFTARWNICGSYDRQLTDCLYDEVGLSVINDVAGHNVTISLFSDGFDPAYLPITDRASQFGYSLAGLNLGLADLVDDSAFTITLPQTDSVSNAPEPATWALMIAGFGAVGFSMRMTRRTAALAG